MLTGGCVMGRVPYALGSPTASGSILPVAAKPALSKKVRNSLALWKRCAGSFWIERQMACSTTSGIAGLSCRGGMGNCSICAFINSNSFCMSNGQRPVSNS